MTTPAKQLISDDPYATATRLLREGANLTDREAGEILSGVGYDQVVAFAALADTDESPAELIVRLADNTPALRLLNEVGVYDIVSPLVFKYADRWSR